MLVCIKVSLPLLEQLTHVVFIVDVKLLTRMLYIWLFS